jgi:hypothetical protein
MTQRTRPLPINETLTPQFQSSTPLPLSQPTTNLQLQLEPLTHTHAR